VTILSILTLSHSAMLKDPSNVREFSLSAHRLPPEAELSQFIYTDGLAGGVNHAWLGRFWKSPLAVSVPYWASSCAIVTDREKNWSGNSTGFISRRGRATTKVSLEMLLAQIAIPWLLPPQRFASTIFLYVGGGTTTEESWPFLLRRRTCFPA
jgi:hypothetical protein